MHVFARLVQVNVQLWRYLIWWGCLRIGLIRSKTTPAQRFTSTLENLGTTFVKLGQGLSLHREFLPDDFVIALQKLQDQVIPFQETIARTEVERSFGCDLSQLFSIFEDAPLAAGSIAQVHKAILIDGRPVIVKVRRLGIKRQIEEDIRILRWFVKSVLFVLPRLRRLDPMEMVDELSRNLHKEISFRQEASNIIRFAEIFKDSPTVYVPGVVDHLYSD